MKTVALWGYYGFGNVGDEALLAAAIELLGEVRLKIFMGPEPSINPLKNFEFIDRKPNLLSQVIKKSDMFMLGPGGLLHDRIKPQATYYHLAGPILARAYHKPYCAIGQQIGPFYRKMTKMLVKMALSRASFITVRDKTSQTESRKIGINTTLSADMAFILKPSDPNKELKDRISSLPKPRFIFAPAIDPRWTPSKQRSADIINHLLQKTQGSVILIPFFPNKDDNYIIDLAPLLPKNQTLVLSSPIRWQDAFGAFTLCDFSVPMRLHAVIASALANLPALPIPYYPKVTVIANEIGYNHMISHDDEDWSSKCDVFLTKTNEIRDTLKTTLPEMVERVKITKNLLQRFLCELF